MTHTLTWNVTFSQVGIYHYLTISTHTLTWSVTRNEYYSLKKINISTHTLTWSVTCNVATFKNFVCYFNSHAHVERDNMVPLNILSALHFNSHAHVERDNEVLNLCNTNKISTHTLTWSVTVNVGK